MNDLGLVYLHPVLQINLNDGHGNRRLGTGALHRNLTDYAKLLEATHREKQAAEVQVRLNKLIGTPNATKTE